MPAADLIYDLGLHHGEDSEFYLKKGFRVVAVEADPELCASVGDRLGGFVASGQLRIVNAAIAAERGTTVFYRSSLSDWSTVLEQGNARNEARGLSTQKIIVDAVTLADLVGEHGDAFYLKIDIEGMDRTALASLATTDCRPSFISIETAFGHDRTFQAIVDDFEALGRLGYDRFKIVDQDSVRWQIPPKPSLAGNYVAHSFVSGSSGLFGEEAPGEWLTLESALHAFRAMVRRMWLPTLLHRNARLYAAYCNLVRHATGRYPNHAWFDIHARHGGCAIEASEEQGKHDARR